MLRVGLFDSVYNVFGQNRLDFIVDSKLDDRLRGGIGGAASAPDASSGFPAQANRHIPAARHAASAKEFTVRERISSSDYSKVKIKVLEHWRRGSPHAKWSLTYWIRVLRLRFVRWSNLQHFLHAWIFDYSREFGVFFGRVDFLVAIIPGKFEIVSGPLRVAVLGIKLGHQKIERALIIGGRCWRIAPTPPFRVKTSGSSARALPKAFIASGNCLSP